MIGWERLCMDKHEKKGNPRGRRETKIGWWTGGSHTHVG